MKVLFVYTAYNANPNYTFAIAYQSESSTEILYTV